MVYTISKPNPRQRQLHFFWEIDFVFVSATQHRLQICTQSEYVSVSLLEACQPSHVGNRVNHIPLPTEPLQYFRYCLTAFVYIYTQNQTHDVYSQVLMEASYITAYNFERCNVNQALITS